MTGCSSLSSSKSEIPNLAFFTLIAFLLPGIALPYLAQCYLKMFYEADTILMINMGAAMNDILRLKGQLREARLRTRTCSRSATSMPREFRFSAIATTTRSRTAMRWFSPAPGCSHRSSSKAMTTAKGSPLFRPPSTPSAPACNHWRPTRTTISSWSTRSKR
jgi:hypothetical protein